jgi:hypothetical protein
VANTLKLYRNRAVGFIDWLDHDSTVRAKFATKPVTRVA